MDGLEARKQVFIMGATNRPGELKSTMNVVPLTLMTQMIASWLSRYSNGRSNPEVVGSSHAEVEDFCSLSLAVTHFLTRANAQKEFHGFTLAL